MVEKDYLICPYFGEKYCFNFYKKPRYFLVNFFRTPHSGVKASNRKMDLQYKGLKMLEKYIYMTKKNFINIGGRIKSQLSIFYTKVDP